MTAWVEELRTYPIKGLSGQASERVSLRAGRGFPRDRRWALARRSGDYREEIRRGLHKSHFHALVKDAALASVRTHLDDDDRLTVWDQDRVVLGGVDLRGESGREQVADFFVHLLQLPDESRPVIARQQDRRFTDVALISDEMMHAVSIINLASVRDLAERTGTDWIDPIRFRANIYLDGIPPHSELDMMGQVLRVGDVELEIAMVTKRCAATTVNPARGEVDLPVLKMLVKQYEHTKMGVYAVVRSGGEIAVGSPVTLPPTPAAG